MRTKSAAWLASLLSLVACFEEDDNYDDTRSRGDLGNGHFVYGCYNDTDTTCDEKDPPLPAAIAVSGRFDLLFSTGSGPLPTVIAPVTDLVRRIDGGFEVRAPGEFAMLAVTGNSEVVDIKHVRGARVAEVRVQRNAELPSASLELASSARTELLALPYDTRGVQLGGALEYAWSSDDEELLSIESLPQLNRVRVRAGKHSGTTTLHVAAADGMFAIDVSISGGESELDAGAGPDAASDTDAAIEELDGGDLSDAGEAGDADSLDADAAQDADADVDGGAP